MNVTSGIEDVHRVSHIVLILGACMMALPFVWMVLSSLKDLSQVFVVPPKWIPDPFIWSNYKDSLTARRSGARISTASTSI